MSQPSSEYLWTEIIAVVSELLSERGEEPAATSPDTKVGHDLGLSSVDSIHLMIMLEDRLNTPLNFQELAVRDGEYVDDISLGELLAFLCRSTGVPSA